jgi:phosphate transport system permease protein
VATTSINLKGKGERADKGFRTLALLAGLLVLVILGYIALVTTREAQPAFSLMGLEFFFTNDWNPPADVFGAAAFIYGTFLSSLIALVFAVPISIGIALFTTQIAPRWLRNPMVYVLDLLAVVPSVVFGLWGVLTFAPWVQGVYDSIADFVEPIPVLNTIFSTSQVSGRSFMTAGLILAIMIIPIITSLSREVIETTPPGEREAALALGATRWEMVRGAVFPHSKGGLTGAVMLGLGRAMGETIAVALVIGSAAQITANTFAPGDSMPAVIANQFGEASGTFRAALIGLAVTLFVITIVVNVIANTVVQRSIKKSRGV